jgi:UDP-N-acetyl-D-mannosaminuronic acid dehydrogenase
VLPGQILRELIQNDRVIGGIDRPSAEAGRALYQTFVRGEIALTDATTAEMVKLMENTFRDVNIAIANELSRLAESLGVDVWQAIELANRHPRVNILRPGPGVGGHCISVDPWFLVEAAPELSPLIRTARQVNDAQPAFVCQVIRRALSAPPNTDKASLAGRRIALLGLAYKPDVDDLRESPALEVAHLLHQEGAILSAYEPYKPTFSSTEFSTAPTVKDAVENAEALVLLVAHTPLLELSPTQVAELTPARIVVDTVNGWDPKAWRTAGFRLFRLGVGADQ